MDEHSQGRRYSPNTLSDSQGTRYAPLGSSASHHGLLPDGPAERYRHGQQQQQQQQQQQLGLSTSARALESNAGGDSQYYPDQISTFPGSTSLSAAQMSYGSDYNPGGADTGARQQQQTVGFGNYNASMMMYSVPQANTQTSIYNTSQYAPSLPSRNNPLTSTPLLSTQADVNPSYFGEEQVSPETTSLEHTANSGSAYYQDIPSSFHYTTAGAESSGGSGSVSGNSLTGVESFYQVADLGASSSGAMAEASRPDRTAEFEEKWQEYQRRLASVFLDVKNGNLEKAADGLLSVSFWLLSRVEELGLTDDDEDLHKDRLKLWQDFNHAWIALVFKQKQHMERVDPDDVVPQPLSMRTVKRMGDELIRLCDGIERHGLVDYQFGVWEDEIESLLEDCLTLFEDQEKEQKEARRRDEANRNG